jgi:hypothetical protein
MPGPPPSCPWPERRVAGPPNLAGSDVASTVHAAVWVTNQHTLKPCYRPQTCEGLRAVPSWLIGIFPPLGAQAFGHVTQRLRASRVAPRPTPAMVLKHCAPLPCRIAPTAQPGPSGGLVRTSWTTSSKFGREPNPPQDGSLMACGARLHVPTSFTPPPSVS